jgi:hypothetical protein
VVGGEREKGSTDVQPAGAEERGSLTPGGRIEGGTRETETLLPGTLDGRERGKGGGAIDGERGKSLEL